MADYGININVQVRDAAIGKLKSQLKELKTLSASAGKNLEELVSNKAVTNQKTLEKRFRTVRRAVENYTRAIINGDAAVKASSQNLRRQAQILKQFGTQIDATSRQSKGFFANIQQAAVNLNLKATMQDLRALKQEAQGTAEALKGGRGGFVFKGAGTQDLLNFVPAKTIDSLTDYSRVLGDVMRQADMGSEIYRELEQRIRAVNAEMSRASRMAALPPAFANANAYGAPAGPALPPGMRMGRRLPSAGAAFRGNNRARDVLTGAGFPLLFGGGPAQALAGGIGGAVGGLGGSIAASAIVSQIEAFGQAIAKVGQSLNPLTFDLQTFASAAGISGTEVEGFLATIEKYGGKAQAAAEASKILAMRIGKDATDALTKFGDDAQKLGNQLSTIFTTVMANIARIVGPLLSQLANALERGNLVRGFKEREGLTGRAAIAQQILTTKGGKGAKNAEIKRLGAQIGLTGTTREILEAAKGIGAETQRTFESQQFTGLSQTASALEAAANAKKPKKARKTEAEREAERLMLQRQRFEEQQLKLQERQIELRNAESQKLENQETLLRARLAGNEEEVRYAIELGQLQEKYGDEEGRRLADKQAAIRGINEALKQQEFIQGSINNLVNTTGQQFAGLFENLINGTSSWNDSLQNVFRTLSSALFRTGLKLLGGGDERGFFSILSGDFTGRALGGQVSAGTPYMVGERGPEMFVPGANGNIVPNNAMGGVQVGSINITVENTGEQLSPAAQKQIANQVQGIVMSTLVNERRSGGVLR
jgi:hypothetical protein